MPSHFQFHRWMRETLQVAPIWHAPWELYPSYQSKPCDLLDKTCIFSWFALSMQNNEREEVKYSNFFGNLKPHPLSVSWMFTMFQYMLLCTTTEYSHLFLPFLLLMLFFLLFSSVCNLCLLRLGASQNTPEGILHMHKGELCVIHGWSEYRGLFFGGSFRAGLCEELRLSRWQSVGVTDEQPEATQTHLRRCLFYTSKRILGIPQFLLTSSFLECPDPRRRLRAASEHHTLWNATSSRNGTAFRQSTIRRAYRVWTQEISVSSWLWLCYQRDTYETP